ncbi:MAG: hypothetical protein ABI670_08270 [Chloroflexota bacterium]
MKRPRPEMSERAWLARYAALGLIVLGGLEWLLGRVISRFAAIPPLEGVGRTIIETLGRTGLFLISTSFLLAAALYTLAALNLGEHANRRRQVADLALAIYLTLFGVFTAAHALLSALAIFADEAWLNVTFNILSAVALWWVALRFLLSRHPAAETASIASKETIGLASKIGVFLVALAYSGWYYSILYSWLSEPGSAAGVGGAGDALRLGELAAALAPFPFFVAIAIPGGEWRRPRRWVLPIVALLLFSAGNIADMIADQGYTGVFAIWSVGFTLYLPWPLYAVSLALFLYALQTCFGRKGGAEAAAFASPNTGMGLLLLFFAGFYLQLTLQHLLALLALLLLTGIARPFRTVRTTDVVISTPSARETGTSTT